MSNMMLKPKLITITRSLLKFNRNNIRFYRPVNYDNESHIVEKMKKYDLPIEVINTLKQHETSINNIEKQLIENNKLFYSLLNEKNEKIEKNYKNYKDLNYLNDFNDLSCLSYLTDNNDEKKV